MSKRAKGTYRVKLGCSMLARKPGKKTNEVILPNTIVPGWVPDKALNEAIMSGYVELANQQNPSPGDAGRSRKEADVRPAIDAPQVRTDALDLQQDDTGEKHTVKSEPTGAQPKSAASQHDVAGLRLEGAEAEAEVKRQQEEEQRALEDAKPRDTTPAPVPSNTLAETEKVSVVVPDMTPTAPEPPVQGQAPQEIKGRFTLTVEQLLGKNLDELNAMVVERLNDEEAASFIPYETVPEVATHLGMDLKKS